MAKVTLTNITNISGNPGSAETNINANFATLAAQIELLLSRDGESPNTMTANLDMNSNRIVNLPVPSSNDQPARLADILSGGLSASGIEGLILAGQFDTELQGRIETMLTGGGLTSELMTALNISQATWTAVIRGSGTAGTYEISSQNCSYFRIGNRVWADLSIVTAGTVTGGGTGDLNITGLPFTKRNNHLAIGPASFDNVDYTNGASLHLMFAGGTPASNTLAFDQTNDAGPNSALPVSAALANRRFTGVISFEIA